MKPAPAINPTREQLAAKPRQVETIEINALTGGVQLRAGFDNDTIVRYAEIYKLDGGASFPPIVVFQDGDHLIIADGHHRLGAAKLAKLTEISAIVKKGDVRAATEYALESNHDHGLPLTNADKRAMVKILLDDEDWAKWSDREISRRCRVSPTFVGELRAKTPKAAAITTRKDKHGKDRKVAKTIKPVDPVQLSDRHIDQLIVAIGSDTSATLEKLTGKNVTDRRISLALLRRFGLGGCSSGPDTGTVAYKGGAEPKIYFDTVSPQGKPSLQGKSLIAAVRDVYKIPDTACASEPEELGPDSITAIKDTAAEKPITVAKQAPLKQRRLEWMREHIAAKLSIGKVGACSLQEAAALSLIVGVTREAETRWSTKLLDRVAGQFIESVGLSVAEALTKYTDGRYPEALSRLPDLPDLCRIYKIDHDALVINAERTVTE